MATARYAALAVLLAGCGEAAVPAARPPRVIPAASASPVPSAEVDIDDFKFKPRVLRVATGTRVTWTDSDEANHSVTFARAPGNLGNIRQGEARSTQFTRPGTYTYVCLYHPSMRARVIVG